MATDIEGNTRKFWSLVEMMPEPRRGQLRALFEGDIGMRYFTAPASSQERFHSAFPGGLLHHSLNVVMNLATLADALCRDRYDRPTLAFVGLFHDLGKVGDWDNEGYIPNPSTYGRARGYLYEINPKCQWMPSSERGLYILQRAGIVLTSDEYLAIRLNDGMYDDNNKGYRMKEPELALLVHWADRYACTQEKSV